MNKIKIEKVTPDDMTQLQQIGRTTFSETFAAVNTEENMKTYLDDSFSLTKLAEQVNNDGSQFYFAVLDGDVIGYLKINTGHEQTEIKDVQGLEIERIYVLKAFHGQSVGQELYEKALEIAAEGGVNYVWLGVWEKNSRAIRFYAKNGFVPFDKHIFKLGSDEQTDIMMKKDLIA
jgi:ribosomal protein S18 acetylase RimI-like enzyme